MGYDSDSDSDDGYAALTLAAQSGHTFVVNELLAGGACRIYRQEKDGWNELLAGGACRIYRQEKDGWTALSWAARKGHASIVDALLKAGARTDLQVWWGDTALDEATPGWFFGGNQEIYDLLLVAAQKTPAQRIAEASMN